MFGLTWATAVYVDAENVSQPPQKIAALNNKLLFNLASTVSGTHARVAALKASGSLETAFDGECLINRRLAIDMGLPIRESKAKTEWGDGTPLPVHGETTVTIVVKKFKSKVTATVVDLGPHFYLLLGQSWLLRHKAILNYGSMTVTLFKGDKRHIIRWDKPPRTGPKKVRPISAKKFVNALRQTGRMLVCHVREVFEVNAEGTNHPHVSTIKSEFSDVITTDLPDDLPPFRNTHEVCPTMQDAGTPYRPCQRLSPTEKQECHDQVTELLRTGRVQPSTSPYGAPVLFVTKKDGSLRMCVDFRGLNKITIRNKYPLPRIDDLLDTLGTAKVFSTLDLKSGYHQIRLQDSDIPKTAFNTPFGHFEYTVMPFGLTNAPPVFQNYMNDVLRPFIGEFCLVYLDDIIVFSKTEDEHKEHLTKVLEKLRENKLYVNPEKCSFFAEEVSYLGHIVSKNGLKADPKKTRVVQEWPQPKDKGDVRSLLGLTNYFRRFIKDYSKMACWLTRLTRDDVAFSWSEKQQESFDKLKEALTSPPVLAMPDFAKPFTVECDASEFALGGILTQDGRPVAYESRVLSPAEQNYDTPDRECLAVVHCYQVWRCYLEGVESTCVTDHHPLTYL